MRNLVEKICTYFRSSIWKHYNKIKFSVSGINPPRKNPPGKKKNPEKILQKFAPHEKILQENIPQEKNPPPKIPPGKNPP